MRLSYILLATALVFVSSCDAAIVSGQTQLQSSDAVVSSGQTYRLLRTTHIDDDGDDTLADTDSDGEERGKNVISAAKVEQLLANDDFLVSKDTLQRVLDSPKFRKGTFNAWNGGGLTFHDLKKFTDNATLRNMYHKYLFGI